MTRPHAKLRVLSPVGARVPFRRLGPRPLEGAQAVTSASIQRPALSIMRRERGLAVSQRRGVSDTAGASTGRPRRPRCYLTLLLPLERNNIAPVSDQSCSTRRRCQPRCGGSLGSSGPGPGQAVLPRAPVGHALCRRVKLSRRESQQKVPP